MITEKLNFYLFRQILALLLIAMLVVGCTPAQVSLPTPAPVAAEAEVHPVVAQGNIVVASAEVVPAQEAHLSFTVSGRVKTVYVAEGEAVQAGAELVRLELVTLEADVAQAEAALDVARAQRALLDAGPRPEAVAAAEAELEAAQAAVSQAAAQRDQLLAGATETAVAAAQAQLAAAQAEEKVARDARDRLRDRHVEGWEEEVAILKLRAAELRRVAAEQGLTLAEEGTEAQVRAAKAAVWAASAQRDAAQAQLDVLRAKAMAEEIAAADAQVAQAEAAVHAARVALDQVLLRAPVDGIVAALDISVGEAVQPGQAVVVLADLDGLRVETTDLSERDVMQVAVEQPASVYVEALDVRLPGRVAEIAPQAKTMGGDVVYTVVIELDERPAALRWGMSAEVEIAVE